MGVINFSKEPVRYWQVAGWAFRQVLDDVAQLEPDDTELQKTFEVAKLYDALSVYSLSDEMADRVIGGLRRVAEGVLSGSVESGISAQPYGNPETLIDYRSGLRDLLSVLPNPGRDSRSENAG